MKTSSVWRRPTASELFKIMDAQSEGSLNLENMQFLYKLLPAEYQEHVRTLFRSFVIQNQKFRMSSAEFIGVFQSLKLPTTVFERAPVLLDPTDLKLMFERRRHANRTKSLYIGKSHSIQEKSESLSVVVNY